jgi:hypothetical protein
MWFGPAASGGRGLRYDKIGYMWIQLHLPLLLANRGTAFRSDGRAALRLSRWYRARIAGSASGKMTISRSLLPFL